MSAFPKFQSAPLTEARGDRCLPEAHLPETGLVSIRSPHRSEGRCTFASTLAPATLFQSAPLTEARGDRTIHYS